MSNPFVRFTPDLRANRIEVEWGWTTMVKDVEGGHICYIPGFNISFAATSEDMIDLKAKALIRSVYDAFFEDPKTGLKKSVLHIRKLGFRAESNDTLIVKQMLNKELSKKANFQLDPHIPEGFDHTRIIHQSERLSVAG